VVEEKKDDESEQYSSNESSESSEDDEKTQGIEFTNYQHLFTQSRVPKKKTSIKEFA